MKFSKNFWKDFIRVSKSGFNPFVLFYLSVKSAKEIGNTVVTVGDVSYAKATIIARAMK